MASSERWAAFHHRDFRLVWGGNLISILGTQMQLTAINWQIYELLAGVDRSIRVFGRTIPLNVEALGLGGVGLARVIPIMIFAVIGGNLADVMNRRRLLLWTNGAAALFAAVLAFLSLTGRITVPVVYLLTSATAAAAAFSSPAFQSLIPNLVPESDLTNAISLNTLVRQIAAITGPALGGLLLGFAGAGAVYAVNALSFAAIIVALAQLQYRGGRAERSAGLGVQAILEGWRFVRGNRIIWSTMLLDFMATFFSSARTMLPLIAGQILQVGPQGYGLLSTAEAVGSLITGFVLSLRRDIYKQGAVLLISVAFYGLFSALFGLSTLFVLSYLCYMGIGASDTVSMVIRQTIRQVITPDRLRGRMTGINQIFFMGGPQLGEIEAGLVASALGAPFAIVSGGLATLLFTGIIAWRYPRLRNYTHDTMLADQAKQNGA
ncbi:MAG: MFS transporter [Caldilineaceae bacterium]|nr:MFS transporter [Caldilineaceae bacterium]